MTIGLQVRPMNKYCGHELHATQSENLYLNILEDGDNRTNWLIPNMTVVKLKNEVDIYTTNLAAEYVSFNKKISGAFKDITTNTCEQEKSITELNLGKILK